jgi:hypothetical protein
MRSNVKMNALVAICMTVLLGTLAAQTPEESGLPRLPLLPGEGPHHRMALRMDDMDDAVQVKGSPFCATVTTEHTQQFADGNRIHTTNDATLCRDSEGRTRRESELDLLGALPQTAQHKLITISDPVAGVRYVLDPRDKIARKISLPQFKAEGPWKGPGPGMRSTDKTFVISEGVGGTTTAQVFMKKIGPGAGEAAPTSENLGDQTIGGVHATGTRITTTIAAGSMGNEQPILVTSEAWFSPELKVTVMTKHNDPWAGEMKTQFTNVTPSAPDHSLFTVPSDYKIVDDKSGPFVFQLSTRTEM